MPLHAPRGLRAATARAVVATLLTGPLLSSCFTIMLWGGDPFADDDDWPGDDPPGTEADADWSADAVLLRVGLTPISLLLDCLTAPVQCWYFTLGKADDDCPVDVDEAHRRRRLRRLR